MLSTHAFAETWIKNNLFFSTGFMFANLNDTFSGSRIYGDDFGVAYSSTTRPLAWATPSLNGGAQKQESRERQPHVPAHQKSHHRAIPARANGHLERQFRGTGTLHDSDFETGEQQAFERSNGGNSST